MATKSEQSISTESLRSGAMQSGTEGHVKVDQRKLIDKILARYSSDFVVFRELIQNADDVRATSFQLSISCRRPDSKSTGHFHGCAITELRASNNGQPFTEVDWERVAAIADGNIDVNSVGQFGVGFFSVFSYSDEPIIISGKEYLVFAWRDDKTLTTYRQKLRADQRSQWTTMRMSMRHPFILLTNPSATNLSKTKDGSTPSDEIIPTIDLQQLKTFFTRVLSFTKNINELIISINNVNVFQVTKSISVVPASKRSAPFQQPAKHFMFQLGSFVHSQRTFSITNGSSLTLDHVSVEAKVTVNDDFHQKIEHSLKKRLPPSVSIQLLYASDSLLKQLHRSSEKNDDDSRLLHSLIPMKLKNGSFVPVGLIFIGFATHQTTGIGMHIHSHLIPTIERESLDLQDPHIAVWNKELLSIIGQITRFIYDRTLSENIHLITGSASSTALLAPFSFQTTSPDSQIGDALLRGFLASKSIIQVPTRLSPLHPQLSLMPASDARLATSASLHEFLDLPLVPFELAQTAFFIALKRMGLMTDVNQEIIVDTLSKSILMATALVTLLQWLQKEHPNDRDFVQRIFSVVRFSERVDSSVVIHLCGIKYFDTLNIPKVLPLPPKVLPLSIACHFAVEDLRLRFSLTKYPLNSYIEFFLSDGQSFLFREAQTSEEVLRFISKYSSQLTDSVWTKIKAKLSQIRCISTSRGMKLPSESYLPSSLSTENQPMVNFQLSQTSIDVIDDDSIPVAFLKRIGCRIFDVTLRLSNSSGGENMRMLIQSLIEERANLADADFQSLQETQFLTGVTLKSSTKRKCAAHELHFPSVAVQLRWSSLLILDWVDIEPHSAQYAFLKEIGVREVPDLDILLDRVVEQQINQPNGYRIPVELIFFAEHFQKDYSSLTNLKKCQRAFLPSVWPNNDHAMLLSPNDTFTESSPLCPRLLPEVTELFASHFRLPSLGVKDKPTLTQAFDLLMKNKDELWKTARRLFSYLSELEGRTPMFIERVSQSPFIPCEGHLVKPTEVFIRSTVTSVDNSEDEHIDTRGLIDFVDFGSRANSFLLGIGVRSFPTATVLATLLMDRQEAYFRDLMNNINESAKKQKTYLYCLKQLAMSDSLSHELMLKPINTRLRSEPWCLGYRMKTKNNGETESICKIVAPREVYLDDDHSLALDISPLCSPEESLLIDLYKRFGSRWLSECAQRVMIHTGHTDVTERSESLRSRIVARLEMLFVNNRGSRFPHLDETRKELIEKTLNVFESEGIEGSVEFEGRPIKPHSKSTCALELKNGVVTLYLLRKHPTIDYFQVASEIARFVFVKSSETYFDAICSRLELSFEKLKERGIPVDRLIKGDLLAKVARVVQPRSVPPPKPQPTLPAPPKHVPFKELNFGMKLLGIVSFPFRRKSGTTSLAHLQSTVRSNPTTVPVRDFRPTSIAVQKNIDQMIRAAQSFTEPVLRQDAGELIEEIHSCTFDPGMHLVRCSQTFYSIPLYVEDGISMNKKRFEAAHQLAQIIRGLVTKVFHMPLRTAYLFRDKKSARIAFNSKGAIFFNLRYYEQVFVPERQKTNGSSSTLSKVVNFYYLTACHELSHNLYPAHDNEFINLMESVAVNFMFQKDLYLERVLMGYNDDDDAGF